MHLQQLCIAVSVIIRLLLWLAQKQNFSVPPAMQSEIDNLQGSLTNLQVDPLKRLPLGP